MNDIRSRIFVVGAESLRWPFDNRGPQAMLKGLRPGAGPSSTTVDPMPCYGHDAELVAQEAARVEALFPVPILPAYHLLLFEDAGRTNGHQSEHYIYWEGKSGGKEPYIVLSGKRIPPHPAMTRYLVAHEYGHCVDDAICEARGLKENGLDREYAELRGLDYEAHSGYGGGKWHGNIGELIANDFRLLVCGAEPEFWPHPGIARPESLPAVVAWWEDAMQYAYRPEERAA